ncbi:MAG: hypothetical protein ACFFBI_05795 [Promethearchaeota archaeon]
MRKKVKRTTLLIEELYLGFISPTIILLLPFHLYTSNISTPYGFESSSLDPITFLKLWLMQQRFSTILVELIGFLLLILGGYYFIFKSNMELDTKLNEI